jgi:transcriptional regulator with XRE-family HTH domain
VTSYPRASTNPAPAYIVALRDARVAAGLSQKALAARLDWDFSRVQAYEQGHCPVRPRFLDDWAGALGLALTVVPIEEAPGP